MTKEQQDIAWAGLPKDARNQIISSYFCKRDSNTEYNKGYVDALSQIYGIHNLTSDTEPEVMLCINKEKFDNFYKLLKHCYNYNHDSSLYDELYWKFVECLPDKELNEDNFAKTKPKFSLNEIVRVTSDDKYGTVGRIIKVDEEDDGFFYTLNGVKDWRFVEKNLEPYTEEKGTNREEKGINSKIPNSSQNSSENCDKENLNSKSDNMEEKELNLAELLKGCEGEEFYSKAYGCVKLKSIYGDIITVFAIDYCDDQNFVINYWKSGKICTRGEQDLFPSKDQRDWNKWASEREPKRWRAEKGEYYIFIDTDGILWRAKEEKSFLDDKRHKCGNYFKDDVTAHQAAEVVRETLEKFHEKNVNKG